METSMPDINTHKTSMRPAQLTPENKDRTYAEY